eukprot:m.32499 g.32499  ORF g.32499 m.32499 type:complete len:97 (-) comp9526_c0_seq2:3143-3433(-)
MPVLWSDPPLLGLFLYSRPLLSLVLANIPCVCTNPQVAGCSNLYSAFRKCAFHIGIFSPSFQQTVLNSYRLKPVAKLKPSDTHYQHSIHHTNAMNI